MKLYNITADQLASALQAFNQRFKATVEPEYVEAHQTYIQCTFRVHKTGDRYTRRGHSGRRMPKLCWHGHRDVFRFLFKRYPTLRVVTCQAAYRSLEHFEATYQATDKNIGSMMVPMQYSEACDYKTCY